MTESTASPLPRFTHPDLGELRSAEARTPSLPFPSDVPAAGGVYDNSARDTETAEKLPTIVASLLAALPDGPDRVRIAQAVWQAADRYCPGRGPETVETGTEVDTG